MRKRLTCKYQTDTIHRRPKNRIIPVLKVGTNSFYSTQLSERTFALRLKCWGFLQKITNTFRVRIYNLLYRKNARLHGTPNSTNHVHCHVVCFCSHVKCMFHPLFQLPYNCNTDKRECRLIPGIQKKIWFIVTYLICMPENTHDFGWHRFNSSFFLSLNHYPQGEPRKDGLLPSVGPEGEIPQLRRWGLAPQERPR